MSRVILAVWWLACAVPYQACGQQAPAETQPSQPAGRQTSRPGSGLDTAPLPRVPPGFTIERAAVAPLVQHPMLAGFDDRGRLFISSSAGLNLKHTELLADPPNFIQVLEDTDGDGRFDKSSVFADKMTLPMGALWYRGALYVASPPNIWRLEDTDGDGVADDRRVLVGTFGFSGNAADVHGCFLGPNGRIYWCDGRHGHEFVDARGNITSKGKAARIFSCRPDGSDVRVFCGGGMDNPVEIDFTSTGEMLGTVNILIGQPRVDCLMHWMEGGVYPREDQQDCIAEFKRTGELLPPMSRLGHVAVSGMTCYRSDQFGPEYRGNVFTAVFNTHRVVRSVLKRSGATFTTVEEDFFVSDDPDCHPTDVLEDADGSLLVIDTGGWFRIGCPTSQVAKPEIHGAIYRIRREGAHRVADPRGLNLDSRRAPIPELIAHLDDSRPVVREKAVEALALRGAEAIGPLSAATHGPSVAGRLQAVWALSRIDDDAAVEAVVRCLDDPEEDVRIAAARSLGTFLYSRRHTAALEGLVRAVETDTPAVRREAATALGHIGPKGSGTPPEAADLRARAIGAVLQGVPAAANDRVLEHALIFAAISIDDREHTLPFLRNDNPLVRRAALIALDQMDSGRLTRELVTPLLDTDDAALQRTALEIISRHEGWAAETLGLLREWLSAEEVSPERAAVIRGVLLAQASDGGIQQLIAEALRRGGTSPGVLQLLLEVLQRAAVDIFPPAWTAALEQPLASRDPAVRLQAVRVIRERGLDRYDGPLQSLAADSRVPVETRVEALAALGARAAGPPEPAAFGFLTGRLGSDADPLDRLAAARALADWPLSESQLLELIGRLEAAGPLAVPVLLRAFARSSQAEVGLKLVAALGDAALSGSLSADELAQLLRNYPESVQVSAAPLLKRLGVDTAQQAQRLAELAPAIEGGNPEAGRELFFGKKAACSGCHTVAGQGGKVGPDLTQIGRIRTGRDLLEAIVFPSASFARGFRSYVVVTTQGKVHTGIISRESADEIVLRTAELAEIRIPRRSIDELRESPVSIMPKGLDQILTPQELRDLLAYVQTRR